MMPPQRPLTDQDLDDINTALTDLEEAQALIEQAQRAGIEVEEFRGRGREARDKLLRIKQTFFAGQ